MSTSGVRSSSTTGERESLTSDENTPVLQKPDPVLDELKSLLKGKGLPRSKIETVDGTLDQPIMRGSHNEETHRDTAEAKQAAVLRKTVAYIVAVVVTDPDSNQVLMIQEAKPECHGLWYLPAGRVERNERLLDAAKRETVEESGMQLEPKTLVAVEMSHRGWFRFIFSGEIRGGRLKSANEANHDSIQAAWLPIDSMLKRADKHHRLRSNDILWLLEVVPDVVKQVIRDRRAPPLLPINHGRDRLYLCCVLAFREESNLYVLASIHSGRHLPVVLISPRDAALYSPLDRLLKDVWKKDSPVISYDPVGLLALEHDPSGGDGLLLAVLCLITSPDRRLPVVRSKDYQWVAIPSQSLASSLSSSANLEAVANDLAVLLDQKLKKIDLAPVIVNV